MFNEKLIDLGPDENFEEATELYNRLSKVRAIVGPIKASVLTDEELKKYLPTVETKSDVARHEHATYIFNEASERLRSNIIASETRGSDIRQSVSEIEIVSDTSKAVPKNPRASADLRLTSAIDEMTRYSESAPPNPSSPRYQASEDPIYEESEGDNQYHQNQEEDGDNQYQYHQNQEDYEETEEGDVL